MSGWKPIEMAPVNFPVLVGAPGYTPVPAILRKIHSGEAGESWQWQTSADLFECFYPQLCFEPTHWQPLPEPPNVT